MKVPRIKVEYRLTAKDNGSELSDWVNALIALGWRPQGGLTTSVRRISNGTNYENKTYYHQAMTRRKLTWE